MAVGAYEVRPTSIGWESEPSTIGRIFPSQASRRAVSADSMVPSAYVAGAPPSTPIRVAYGISTLMVGRSPPTVGSLGLAWASATMSAKPSASRCAAVLLSGPVSVDGRGLDKAPSTTEHSCPASGSFCWRLYLS